MENNKSSLVPFTVMSPSTGRDITANIKLTSIETEGTSVPYFKANGNDTFTVINAETTETMTPTTFHFNVDDGGVNYELTANSNITIDAVTGGTLLVKPVTGSILGETNTETYFDYTATWRGEHLLLNEINMVNTGNSSVFTVNREEMLLDGITHRVYINPVAVYNSPGLGIRFNRTSGNADTVNDGYLVKTVAVVINTPNILTVTLPNISDRILVGNVGDVLRIYPIILYGGLKIPVTISGMTITQAGTGSPNILLTNKTADYLEYTLKGPITNGYASANLSFTYDSQIVPVAFSVNVVELNATKIKLIPLTETLTAEPQNVIFKAELPTTTAPGGLMWSVDGAKFISGNGRFIDKVTSTQVGDSVQLTGFAPDQIQRYIKTVNPGYMEQDFEVTGTLGVIRKGEIETIGFNTMPIETLLIPVSAAPVSIVQSTDMIDNTLDAKTPVVFKLMQKRFGVNKAIVGVLSNVVVVGAGVIDGSSSQGNGSYLVQIKGTGNIGEVGLTARVTESDGTVYLVDIKLTAETTNVSVVPVVINTAIWQTGSTLPFKVMRAGVDVTDEIVNVELYPSTYVGKATNGTDTWEIINSTAQGLDTNVYYSFELFGDAGMVKYTATGTFRIAAWDGKSFVITGIPDLLEANVGKEGSFTIYPTYKGKPTDIEIVSIGAGATYITGVTHTLAPDGNSVVIKYTGTLATPSDTSLTYVFKIAGSAGDVEGLNKLTTSGKKIRCYSTGLQVISMAPTTLSGVVNHEVREVVVDIYDNGIKIPTNDPSIEFYTSQGVEMLSCRVAAITETSVYLHVNQNNNSGTTINNNLSVRKVANPSDVITRGVTLVYGSGSTKLRAAFEYISVPVPASMNVLKGKLKLTNSTYLSNAEIIGPLFSKTPTTGNAYISINGPVVVSSDPAVYDINATLGHTGSELAMIAVAKVGTAYNVIERSPIAIPQSPVTISLADNTFSGLNNKPTVVTVGVNQKRYGTPQVDWKFPAATISGQTFTGTIKSVTAPVNNGDGTVTFTVVGTGVVGAGSVGFSIVEDGITYPATVSLMAAIDDSLVTFELGQTSIEGKYGTQHAVPVTLKYDNVVVPLDDASVTFTLSSADIISIASKTTDTLTFNLIKEVEDTTDYTVDITVSINGAKSTKRLAVKILGIDLVITQVPINANVWDRGKNLPFTVKLDGVDVTSQLVGVTFTNTGPIIKDPNFGDLWAVQKLSAGPATTYEVSFTWRLPTDPASKVRTTIGTFNIAVYDGIELKIITKPDIVKFVKGTSNSPQNFTIWYRNYPVPNTSIMFLPSRSTITPAAVSQATERIGNDGFRLHLSSGISGKATGTFIFGINTASQTEGVNIVTALIPIEVYEPGLSWGTPQTRITGRKGNIVGGTNMTLLYNGSNLPLNTAGITYIPTGSVIRFDHASATQVFFEFLEDNRTGADILKDVRIDVGYAATGLAYNQQTTNLASIPVLTLTPNTVQGSKGDVKRVAFTLNNADGTAITLTGAVWTVLPAGVVTQVVDPTGKTIDFTLIKDVTVDTTDVLTVSCVVSGRTGTNTVSVKTLAPITPLVKSAGFQTTGSGDLTSPLTLTQSVEDPN